jgi:hypothetical protein
LASTDPLGFILTACARGILRAAGSPTHYAVDSGYSPAATSPTFPWHPQAKRTNQRKEQIRVQAFIPQLPIEARNEPTFYRPPRPDKVQPHVVLISPLIENPAAELTPIVYRDAFRLALEPNQPLQALYHSLTGQRPICFQQGTFPAELIDDLQHTQRSRQASPYNVAGEMMSAKVFSGAVHGLDAYTIVIAIRTSVMRE